MQCDRAQEQFSDYLEGSLTAAMRQVFDQHLSTCEPCRADVEQLRDLYAMLDDGVPMVETPPGFRAGILNAIREQPAPETILSRLRSWLVPTGAGQPRYAPIAAAFVLVAAIIAVGGRSLLINRGGHSASPQASAGQAPAIMNPWETVHVGVQNENGILQGVHDYTSGSDTYHVFGLHLPNGMAATTANAYVIQNPAALTSDTALQDPANATLAWTGSIEPGVSVQVPVAVVSNVPAGTSMTLLVEWNDSVGEHREACIMPISSPAQQSMVVSAGEPLQEALESVAVAYQTPVMVNDAAVSQLTQPIAQSLDSSDTTMNACLANLALPANLSFKQQSDNSYLIDSQ